MEYANYTATLNNLINYRKRILIVVVVLVAVAAIAVPAISIAYSYSFPLVQLKHAHSGNLDITTEAIGEIKIDKQLQDILKLEKITAQGDWKIKEVRVTNDDVVKKGTLLATIDLDDLNTQIRMKELQITKFQIDIERLKNSNDNAAELAILQNDAQQAMNEVNKLQQDMDRMNALYKAKVESLVNVQTAEKALSQAKLNYENKLKLIDAKKDEINKNKNTNELLTKQTNIDIELKRTEINLLKTNLPLNGEIRSAIEGKVKSIYVVPGLNCTQGKVLFEIEKTSADAENDKSIIQWKLDGKQGEMLSVGDEIAFDVKMPREMSIKEKIKSKEFKAYDSSYVFTCPLRNSELFQNGQQVRVYKTNKSMGYDKIVPKDSVVRTGSNKGYIFIIKKNKETSGKDLLVQKVQVDIDASNDTECAVSGNFNLNDDIVTYSNKALSDGTRVRT